MNKIVICRVVLPALAVLALPMCGTERSSRPQSSTGVQSSGLSSVKMLPGQGNGSQLTGQIEQASQQSQAGQQASQSTQVSQQSAQQTPAVQQSEQTHASQQSAQQTPAVQQASQPTQVSQQSAQQTPAVQQSAQQAEVTEVSQQSRQQAPAEQKCQPNLGVQGDEIQQAPYFIAVKVPLTQVNATEGVSQIMPLSLPIPVDNFDRIDGDRLLSAVVEAESSAMVLPLNDCAKPVTASVPAIVDMMFATGVQNASVDALAWKYWMPIGSQAGVYGYNSVSWFGTYSVRDASCDCDRVYAPTFGFYLNGGAYQYHYSFFRQTADSNYFFYFN